MTKNAKSTDSWNPNFFPTSPMFWPLSNAQRAFKPEQFQQWPNHDAYNAFLDATNVCNAKGQRLKATLPITSPTGWHESYEPTIFAAAELPVHEQSWHDFFQLLAWASYPLAKAQLNASHVDAIEQRSRSATPERRSPAENALTLFDENGAVILCSNPALIDAITQFRWKYLFWECRDALYKSLRCSVFGHALFEKALNPYIGMCAHAIILQCDEATITAPINEQTNYIDRCLSKFFIEGTLVTPKQLQPFPLLGMPGWFNNSSEFFYDNVNYFRAGRRR